MEFAARVKKVLAGRAAYRCSFPGCGKATIGPGYDAAEVCSIGIAAHIFSAAQGGPRGQGGESASFLASAENGIWLCVEHATLVDNNRGTRYPLETLRRFKYLHEARAAMTLGHRPLGWVDRLTIHSSRVFQPESTLRLSKVLLVAGANGSGKTFLYRLLNSLSAEARSQPGKIFLAGEQLSFSIQLSTPERHELVWSQAGPEFQLRLDGEEVPFNPLPVDILFHERVRRHEPLEIFLGRRRKEVGGSYEQLDDVELLSEYLGLGKDLVRKLLPKAGTLVEHGFDDVRVVDQNGFHRILVNDKRWRPDAPLHRISGGMLEMLDLDLTIAQMMLTCEHSPALLLLNLPLLHLDYDHLRRYVEFLFSERTKFQTLITTPCLEWLESDMLCALVHLRKHAGQTVIEEVV